MQLMLACTTSRFPIFKNIFVKKKIAQFHQDNSSSIEAVGCIQLSNLNWGIHLDKRGESVQSS